MLSQHHSNQEQDDHDESFEDQRLSDLLPMDFINLVGLDPDQYLFSSQSRRRMTEPIFFMNSSEYSSQRRYSSILSPYNYNFYQVNQQMNKLNSPTPIAIFKVQLIDSKVKAYSNFDIQSDVVSVVVLDGQYLRFGRILQKLDVSTNYDLSARRIIIVDKQSLLSDYIYGQTQIANSLMPTFIKRCGIKTDLLGLEFVSFQARALLRIRLRNASIYNLDALIKLVIQAFHVAVEIYE